LHDSIFISVILNRSQVASWHCMDTLSAAGVCTKAGHPDYMCHGIRPLDKRANPLLHYWIAPGSQDTSLHDRAQVPCRHTIPSHNPCSLEVLYCTAIVAPLFEYRDISMLRGLRCVTQTTFQRHRLKRCDGAQPSQARNGNTQLVLNLAA
jgi:hypothetical protein